MTSIETIDPHRDLQTFLDVPHLLYRNDICYVPALGLQQRTLLDPHKNPFFRHSSMELFIAKRNGKAVGRIAAIINNNHNRFHNDKVGFWGFFDCENNVDTTKLLLDTALNHVATNGTTLFRGPVNPDTNNSCGILIDGFKKPPAAFMPYNAPYYHDLLVSWGATVCKQLNAWDIQSSRIPQDMINQSNKISTRLIKQGYKIRSINLKNFDQDIISLWQAYNNSLELNWGTVPLTQDEFFDQASGLKQICKPDFIQLVEFENTVVGYIGAVPDMNEILINIPGGRLFPLGWWRLLTGMHSIKKSRIVMFGVHQAHRFKGIPIWLYISIVNALRDHGFTAAEASYVLEDNAAVNDLSQALGGQLIKRYALYDKIISTSTERVQA